VDVLGTDLGTMGKSAPATSGGTVDSYQYQQLKNQLSAEEAVANAGQKISSSGDEFFSKASNGATDFATERLPDGNIKFSYTVPGRVPGSSAIYEKTVDSLGRTTNVIKTTYDPAGKVVHIKDKF